MKIEDEYSHIKSREKRYQLRHPEKWKEKQRKYLETAHGKYMRHQAYLKRGQTYEARQRALKQVIRRSLGISLQKLKEMAYEEAFETKGMGKGILLEDLETLIKQCNKHLTDTAEYKFTVEMG